MKALFIYTYLTAAAVLFAAGNTYPQRYTVTVHTLSNGKEKTIYTTINNQKTENKIVFTLRELDSNTLEIRSEKFKLGKMPFSSSFVFVVPKKTGDSPDTVSITNCTGVYKVAASKAAAVLNGTLRSTGGTLYLETSGMGKKLTMQLSDPEKAD